MYVACNDYDEYECSDDVVNIYILYFATWATAERGKHYSTQKENSNTNDRPTYKRTYISTRTHIVLAYYTNIPEN